MIGGVGMITNQNVVDEYKIVKFTRYTFIPQHMDGPQIKYLLHQVLLWS